MSRVRQIILERLADGMRHSGADLATELDMTRAAVARHVRVLREAGWPIRGQVGQGYQLQGERWPIRQSVIERALAQATVPVSALEVVAEIESTSDHLVAGPWPDGDAVRVCVAEMQTAGRGRRGQTWLAAPGGSIAFSLARRFAAAPMELGALGLVVGVCVTRVLRELGLGAAGLKWPNDVLVHDRKLAGILIDLAGESTGPCRVVIGIGINHDLGALDHRIDQAVTDLRREGVTTRRDEIIAALLPVLLRGLVRFEQEGLGAFIDSWREFDALYDRTVAIDTGRVTETGIARGIDEEGALCVDVAGNPRRFHAAEVSVRPGESA